MSPCLSSCAVFEAESLYGSVLAGRRRHILESIISQLCGNKFRRRVRAGPAPAGLVFGVPTVMFVVYALVDGLISFILALRTSDRGARRWLPLAE
jgi:hypothetical protein